MDSNSSKYLSFNTLFYFGFACFLFGLSVSKVVVSVSQFIMAFAWLADGNIKQKIRIALQCPIFISCAGIYLIHILGLLYSTDLGYGLKDVRIKLPLLIVPFMFAGFNPVNQKYKEYILYFFWLGLITACVGAFWLYLGFGSKEITDARYLSPFISHIRFSLLLVFGILSVGYYFKTYDSAWPLILALLFLFTLFIIKAITGFVVLGFVLFSLALLSTFRYKRFLLLSFLLLALSFVAYSWWFYTTHFVASEEFDEKSLKKGYYTYNIKEVEQGNWVWKDVNEIQLQKEWDKMSDIPYNGKNLKGQPIRNTLIRYLTSKGLTKDSAGLAQLTLQDYINIKNGFANVNFTDVNTVHYKLYQLLYEIHLFLVNDFVDNHSITMRWLFLKNGLEIWNKNFWFGVGTGDVQKEFDWMYEANNVRLSNENRLRSHNQFVTFGLTFGFFGFLLILFLLLRLFKSRDKFFNIAYAALLISFLNEDMLETQIGVSVFIAVILLFNFLAEDGINKDSFVKNKN